MSKVLANDVRHVQVSSDDVALIRRHNPDLDEEGVNLCAVVSAAARMAHSHCGPGIRAPLAMMTPVAKEMRRNVGQALLKAE